MKNLFTIIIAIIVVYLVTFIVISNQEDVMKLETEYGMPKLVRVYQVYESDTFNKEYVFVFNAFIPTKLGIVPDICAYEVIRNKNNDGGDILEIETKEEWEEIEKVFSELQSQ